MVVGGDHAGEGRQNCVLVFVVVKVSLIYNLILVSNVQQLFDSYRIIKSSKGDGQGTEHSVKNEVPLSSSPHP